MFITFEGIEGSGKSLQIGRAESLIAAMGIPCVATREPGGTELGRAIRHILLHPEGAPLEPVSELLLYLCDRYQHLREVIEPALEAGKVVLCDRYHDATRAYQGAARGIPAGTVDGLAEHLRIREPNRTVLLDLAPEEGLARALARNRSVRSAGEEGRFEAEDLSFHRRVRDAYLELARRSPERIHVVSAAGSEDAVFARIEPLLREWLRAGG